MIRRPPRSTRTDTLFPYTTLFRSYKSGGNAPRFGADSSRITRKIRERAFDAIPAHHGPGEGPRRLARLLLRQAGPERGQAHGQRQGPLHRSEEHTSELQSLMRTSYAVFCLKKKNKKNK